MKKKLTFVSVITSLNFVATALCSSNENTSAWVIIKRAPKTQPVSQSIDACSSTTPTALETKAHQRSNGEDFDQTTKNKPSSPPATQTSHVLPEDVRTLHGQPLTAPDQRPTRSHSSLAQPRRRQKAKGVPDAPPQQLGTLDRQTILVVGNQARETDQLENRTPIEEKKRNNRGCLACLCCFKRLWQ